MRAALYEGIAALRNAGGTYTRTTQNTAHGGEGAAQLQSASLRAKKARCVRLNEAMPELDHSQKAKTADHSSSEYQAQHAALEKTIATSKRSMRTPACAQWQRGVCA